MKPYLEVIANASAGSDAGVYKEFRIQAVRMIREADMTDRYEVITDADAGLPGACWYAVYGIGVDNLAEHITDCGTAEQARELLRKLGVTPAECSFGLSKANYSFAEALADLAWLYAQPKHEGIQPADSREGISNVIRWAAEFEAANRGTVWGVTDGPEYFDAIEAHFLKCIAK